MSDDSPALEAFDGTVRLFPLPNVVLFPHAVQALHIFEPRYREMTADALAGDRLIAPALLRPGWEEDYDSRPAVYPVVCVGKVVADHKLEDGRYNLLLRGVARASVVEEPESDRPYRSARVELIADGPLPTATAARVLRAEIGEVALPWFRKHAQALEQFMKLLQGETPLGTLCDLLSFAVPLRAETKQRLLAEPGVACRAEMLAEALRKDAPAEEGGRKFPPEFSPN